MNRKMPCPALVFIIAWMLLLFPPCSAAAERPAEPAVGSIMISEVMPSNKSILADTEGKFGDWIELYNSSLEGVQLEGYELICGKDSWVFPQLWMDAESFLVLFCDGESRRIGEEIHVGFSIRAEGEELSLLSPDRTLLDRVPETAADRDCSLIRTEDGSFKLCRWPTPGFENTEAGYSLFQKAIAPVGDDLVLSEVMTSNDAFLPLNGAYYDWVELYNPTDHVLNLSDYYLSDKEKQRTLFRLPEQEIRPGEYQVFYCKAGLEHQDAVPFSLNAREDELYLSRKDGHLCDYMCLREIPVGCSYGRLPGEGLFFFASPSPSEANLAGTRFTGEKPVLDGRDGVFSAGETATVVLNGRGVIRYTTDGSEPDETSDVYITPITVSKTSVIRAASFEENHFRSDVLSLTYLIGENHRLPVVSLVCDGKAFFSSSGGVYYTPSEDLKTKAAVMFYEETGSFRLDCDVKLHGATSKFVQEKKSLRLNFENRYEGELHYDLFHNGITSFSAILLRSAQEGRSSTYMRDALMHDVAKECFPELPSQDHRYCVLYINGQYWGVYNIREAHSASHFASHYGYDSDTVTQWKEKWDKKSMFQELYQFALEHDLSKQENYEHVAQHVDVESVIGWLILQGYCGNIDFNSPNMRFYWTEEDQMLHYALVDLDLGLFTNGDFGQLIHGGFYAYNKLAGALMKNAAFREKFCVRLNEALTGPLSDEAMLARIDRFAEELQPEIARDKARWGGKVADWEKLVDDLRFYVTQNKGQAQYFVKLLRTGGYLKTAEVEQYLPAFR